MVGHEVRTGGAIQPNPQEIVIGNCGIERLDILACEQRPHRLDGARDGDTGGNTGGRDRALDTDQASLAVDRVLHRLQQQQVGTTLDQPFRLLLIGVCKIIESNAAGDRNAFGRRTHRAGNKPRTLGSAEGVRLSARELRRDPVEFPRLSFESVLCQHHRRRAEAIGLDNVGSGFEKAAMQLADLVRTGDDEIFVAAVEARAAEVARMKVHALDGGSGGAVEYNDPLRDQATKDFDSFSGIGHRRLGPLQRGPVNY